MVNRHAYAVVMGAVKAPHFIHHSARLAG